MTRKVQNLKKMYTMAFKSFKSDYLQELLKNDILTKKRQISGFTILFKQGILVKDNIFTIFFIFHCTIDI